MREHTTIWRPWNPWPISIIAFFTVAIIGCGTFIAFCSRHPADLVAADYYEQEVRYQRQIERLQHGQQPAATAVVTYDAKTKLISIALPPNHSQTKPSGTIQLYRPSATNLDRQLKLAPDEHGLQTIDAGSLLPGLWKVRVSWTADEQEYFLDEKIVIGVKAL
jgi:nitrogen fixation protein FixH